MQQKFKQEGPFSDVEIQAIKNAEPTIYDEFALSKDLGDLAVVESETPPTLLANESKIWNNTVNGSFNLVFSPDGTHKYGVELSEIEED